MSATPGGGRQAGDVRIEDVVKRFGHVLAVDHVSLTVPDGSFFALLGPSGCGKTTTLRMIGGLEEPTSGRIYLGSEDITDRKPYRRPVNTVFQSYALFPHLSIAENVAFGLRRKGMKDVAGRVEQMLDLVELSGYGGRRPTQLSGGQQQRVALARALINHPKVLLLDEPLGALDLKLRRQMQLELKHLQTEVGTTFIHVTHDQEEAMTMADTIAVMNEGRVEQLGSPQELYERPATAFVANFLGQSNLLAGTVTERDGDGLVVTVAGTRLAVPRTDRAPASVGAAVQVGVRPEKIHIAPAADPVEPGLNRLRGQIRDSSFIGVSTEHVVEMPWGQVLTVFAQNLRPDERLVPGSEVSVSWDPRHTFAVEGQPGPAVADDAAPEPGQPAVPTPGRVAGTVAETADR